MLNLTTVHMTVWRKIPGKLLGAGVCEYMLTFTLLESMQNNISVLTE